MIAPNVSAAIGAALRAARIERGVTQDDLATLLGVDRVTVSRYEGGKRTLSVPTLVQIADYLDVPVTKLIPGSPEAPAETPPARRIAEGNALQTVVSVLQQRPDLVPMVLDMLETLLDAAPLDQRARLPENIYTEAVP